MRFLMLVLFSSICLLSPTNVLAIEPDQESIDIIDAYLLASKQGSDQEVEKTWKALNSNFKAKALFQERLPKHYSLFLLRGVMSQWVDVNKEYERQQRLNNALRKQNQQFERPKSDLFQADTLQDTIRDQKNDATSRANQVTERTANQNQVSNSEIGKSRSNRSLPTNNEIMKAYRDNLIGNR